jgi:hypothetical protein
MYERDRGMNDSAMVYYAKLLEAYPRSEYAKEIYASYEFALAKINGVEADSSLLRDLDKELLDKAKAGEADVLQQLIKNNQNAIQMNGPNLSLPNIPGLTPPGGGSVNDMLQQQLKNATGKVVGSDSTQVSRPLPPK